MKRFLGFVRKEFLHIFRDPLTMIIIFVIPAIQILLFGFVISTELKKTKIAFLDHSKDEITRQITAKICSSGFFIKYAEPVGYRDAEEMLRQNRVKAVIIPEEDFGRKLISEGTASLHIIADGSEPNMATLITSHISAIISDFNNELAGSGMQKLVLVQPEVRMFYNPALKGQFMFVPGVITLILILICALMTSITITREKEFGTMEVLLVSPLRPVQIILGKVLPYFILSFVDVILILLLSWFVFKLPVKGNLALLLAELMLYILMSLSLGILISTVAKNMQQAIFISLVGMMLPTVLLSGFIIPVESMPLPYQWFSKILPPAYFITIIKNIMIKGTGIGFVWKETLFLVLFTLGTIGLSLKNFRVRLQ